MQGISPKLNFFFTDTNKKCHLFVELQDQSVPETVSFPLLLFLEVPYEPDIEITVIQQDWMRSFVFQHGYPDFASSKNFLPSGLHLLK